MAQIKGSALRAEAQDIEKMEESPKLSDVKE
jgi:hypothetical protein